MERYVELYFLELVLFSSLLVIDVMFCLFLQNFHFLSNSFMAVFHKGIMQF